MTLLEPLVLKKITVLGTTGSGKTTFLASIFGDFEKNDVARNIFTEVNSNLDFSPLNEKHFLGSTTTVSMNILSTILALTNFNKLEVLQYKDKDKLDFENIDEAYKVLFADAAGQVRFSFMQDIAIKGAHLVIIMADGTNISSVEKIIHYLDMVRMEEQRVGRDIPVLVFINKSDLKEIGAYLGKEVAERIIFSALIDRELLIYETSNFEVDSYEMPLTIIFNYLSMQNTI